MFKLKIHTASDTTATCLFSLIVEGICSNHSIQAVKTLILVFVWAVCVTVKDYTYRMVKVQIQQYLTKPNHCIWPIRTDYTFVSTNEQFAPNEDDLAMVQRPSTITILYMIIASHRIILNHWFKNLNPSQRRNIPQVVLCLFALGRQTQLHRDFTGPKIGPKIADKNERNFSEEQIRCQRDGVIGLQAGTNIGATQVTSLSQMKSWFKFQSGMGAMGNSRHM